MREYNTPLINKAVAVLQSCKTRGHYETALSWLSLARQERNVRESERPYIIDLWITAVRYKQAARTIRALSVEEVLK